MLKAAHPGGLIPPILHPSPLNRENTGVESFFNMGVTGADVRDNMTSYYKMVTYGKAPKVLLWSIDPWVFYGSEAAFDARADADLYNEFLTKVLNVPTDYEEPDKVELWKALADGEEMLVVLAHGGTQMAAMERYALPHADYYHWCAPNAGGYVLDAGDWAEQRVLHLLKTVQYTKEDAR